MPKKKKKEDISFPKFESTVFFVQDVEKSKNFFLYKKLKENEIMSIEPKTSSNIFINKKCFYKRFLKIAPLT